MRPLLLALVVLSAPCLAIAQPAAIDSFDLILSTAVDPATPVSTTNVLVANVTCGLRA